MREALFIFLIFFLAEHSAQAASVVFQTDNKDSIQVTINNIKQHNNYNNSIRINQLKGNSPYNVRIDFKNDTAFVKTNIYIIAEGLAHIYHIDKKEIQLKKIVPSASLPNTKNQEILTYLINVNEPIDTAVNDTLLEDTTYIVPFASYYKLENYEGKIGCPFPLKPEEQAELRGIILAENLEESKLEKVKIAIQDMDSACVLVDQTKELIVLFEYEETRLNFAKFMYPYTFDIDNYEKLYSVFNFENSKDELKLLLK